MAIVPFGLPVDDLAVMWFVELRVYLCMRRSGIVATIWRLTRESTTGIGVVRYRNIPLRFDDGLTFLLFRHDAGGAHVWLEYLNCIVLRHFKERKLGIPSLSLRNWDIHMIKHLLHLGRDSSRTERGGTIQCACRNVSQYRHWT